MALWPTYNLCLLPSTCLDVLYQHHFLLLLKQAMHSLPQAFAYLSRGFLKISAWSAPSLHSNLYSSFHNEAFFDHHLKKKKNSPFHLIFIFFSIHCHPTYYTSYLFIFYIIPFQTECKILDGRKFCLFHSLLYLLCLKHWLPHSSCSVNVCLMDE